MTPELSRRLGEAVGTKYVSLPDQEIIRDGIGNAETWADLPVNVRQLVEDIEARPDPWSLPLPLDVGPAGRSAWHPADCVVCQKRHLPGKHDQLTHGGKGGFEEQIGKAASNQAALDASPADMRGKHEGRRPDAIETTKAERAALDGYSSDAQEINDQIRTGKLTPEHEATVGEIDGVMHRSKLDHDIEVWRGVTDGRSIFGGDDLPGDLTGREWTEKAFVSTSADRRVSEAFGGMFNGKTGPPVLMRVLGREGTGAITLSSWGSGNPLFGGQAEVLLERGLSFRVVADHGVIDHPMLPGGHRTIDVEMF